jgi:hypothetical protein
MTEIEEFYQRPFFKKSRSKAFIFYKIFGKFSLENIKIDTYYQTAGLPKNCQIYHYTKKEYPQYFDKYKIFFRELIDRYDSNLVDNVLATNEFIIIKGTFADSEDLSYIKDLMGIITYFLDNGGIAVNDLQIFTWYDKEEWNQKFFTNEQKTWLNHVLMMSSDEENSDKKWFHTRGMRKFARPDISIHHVKPENKELAIKVMKRLVLYQIQGAIIKNHETLKMYDGDISYWFLHQKQGSLDDPDFNNYHLEIAWDL